MKTNPLVSVVVPSYNHSIFIEKCLDSIFSQTYTNFEVIVIDDGSHDNSQKVLIELQNKYKFRLVLQSNRGISATLNRGIKEFSQGKYFTFCASDDLWMSNKLELQVEYLEINPSTPMVYGKAKIIDNNGDILTSRTIEVNKKLKGGSLFKDLLFQNFHPPVNYMIRLDVISDLGYYDELAWAEDFDMNLRISDKYYIGYIDDYLSYYRIGVNSNSYRVPHKISTSHLYSISKFKTSEYYFQALEKWHYRNFIWNAQFKQYKKPAFTSMINSLSFINDKAYLKGLRDLVFYWN